MARKSERNKAQSAQAAPEKVAPERGRKSTRIPRRKKKSSSESDGETEAHVEKETKEVVEATESKAGPPESDVVPDGKQDSLRSRRSTRRHPVAPETEKEPEPDKPSDWKEDPTFWGPEEAAPQGEKTVEDEGTTWKIQSSNGSGGEIQKLKICRQRVSESTDASSSPATVKDASSPRRKKGKSIKNLDDNTESGGDASSSNEAKSESKSEPEVEVKDATSNKISESEPAETATAEESHIEIVKQQAETAEQPSDKSAAEEPESNKEPADTSDQKEDGSDETKPPTEESPKEEPPSSEQKSRKSSTEENELSETKSQKSSVEGSEIQETSRRTSTEEDKSRKSPIEEETFTPNTTEEDKSKNTSTEEEKSRKSSTEEEKSRKSSTEEDKSEKVSTEGDPPKISETPVETSATEEKTVIPEAVEEGQISESNNNNVEPRVRTKSETSEDGKGEKKVLGVSKVKVPVNSEVAMDEIAKKLNERAARFSKDSTEIKEKKRDSTESGEPKSPREEGELTPVPEPLKKKHTTIVINKPKEITCQPTIRLKRNIDELPPTERKRRVLSKLKSKDKEEDPINISSQSLMLLVPEVKTITPEQVASFPLDDDDLSKFELDQPNETKMKKKIDLKPKEVEIRVQNDTRQVIKKKPIVIDTKDNSTESKAVGPKLPSQENHRVVRKISLMSEDSKKPRRSPSPGGRAPTEVLFITNLVRPFTVPQLRELLARTGTIATNGFYIDKIKSKCYVKYTDIEMAVETRHALNGVRWPVNNPKTLKVEFATAEDMAIVQKLADEETVTKKPESSEPAGWLSEQAALKPQRRVTAAVREWDMGKVGAGVEEKKPPTAAEEWRAKQEPTEQKRRPISPVELKYEPPPRKVKKRDNDAPARLLDDLFRKTKATPCIYWLPLTAEQIAIKEEMRRQHMAEHERKLAELRKPDHTRRDKDREKSRDRRKK